MKLLYNKLSDINIATFYDVQDIANDDSISDFEKNIRVLSVFTGISYEDLLKENANECQEALTEINKIYKNIDFVENNQKNRLNKITINNIQYKIIDKLDDISVAQYIDFQNWCNYKPTNNIAEILSVFLIPEGFSYNTGYDVLELVETIKNEVSIDKGFRLYNFFLHLCQKSTNKILTFSRIMIKMMMFMMKMPKNLRTNLDEAIKNMTVLYGSHFQTYTQKPPK